MRTDESSHLSSGKRIALYPGAFRPPHAAHMHAVQYLANHPDIDEVVIIISGRFRHIPGTDLALGPEVAEAIWQIYLEGLTNVRVVIASQTAVNYALDYFDKVLPDQTLLLYRRSGPSIWRFAILSNLSASKGNRYLCIDHHGAHGRFEDSFYSLACISSRC